MIRARVQNGRWVLDDPAGLPEGTVVEIVTRPAAPASATAGGDVYLDAKLVEYIRALLAAACSPRYSAPTRRPGPQEEEEIAQAARENALRANRKYTIPTDIHAAAPEILARFVVVPAELRARDVSPQEVVKRIISETPVP